MQRYFIFDQQIEQDLAKIVGKDVHHITHVMRFSVGDQIIVNTYNGDVFLSEIIEFSKLNVVVRLVKKLPTKSLNFQLDLGLALTKKDAFEYALKKVTELGVSGIIPLMTERSMIKVKDFDKKKQRFLTICKESAEQSERHQIPRIDDISKIGQIDVSMYKHLFYAYARHDGLGLYQVLKEKSLLEKSLVLIGPEGGFSASELELMDKLGFQRISLGSTILRAETAAIYVAGAFRLMAGEKDES